MIIRKLFKFENAHIVRECSTKRCKESIHGHSYKVEVLLESKYLDNAGMVYDFGLMKQNIKDIIDSFDHATTIWNKDESSYIEAMKNFSSRWILLPVNPSAEQFARVFFLSIDKLMNLTNMINGEEGVKLHSIIVHETQTGYAQAFREDAYSKIMGEINLKEVIFSKQIHSEWKDTKLWEKLLNQESFTNPKEV